MTLPIDPIHDMKRPVYFMWSPLHETSDPHNVKHFVTAMVHNLEIQFDMFNCSITVIYCSFSSSMNSDEHDVTEEGETLGKGNACDVTDETRHIDSDVTENGHDETSLENKDKGSGRKGLGNGKGKAKGKSSMNNANIDKSAVKEEIDSEKEVKPGDFLCDERVTEQDTKNGKDSSSDKIVILCSKKSTSATNT